MLRHLYYGEQELSSINACELLPVSRSVNLTDLQALCQKKCVYFACYEHFDNIVGVFLGWVET